MGTAVLFPQDCLPISKNRHRNNFTDAFSGTPIVTDGTFQLFDACFLYPDHARHSFAPYNGGRPLYPYQARNVFTLYPLQREVERRKPKSRRPWDPQEDVAHSAMPVSNLQRPKDSEVANEMVASFLTKAGTNKLPTWVSESRLGIKANGTKPSKLVQNVFLDRKKKNGLNGKKAFFDSQMEKSKFQDFNLGLPKFQHSVLSTPADGAVVKDPKGDQSKPQNVMMGDVVRPRRSCDDYLMPSKGRNQVPLGVSAEQSLGIMHTTETVSPKVAFTKHSSRVHAVGSGLTRLRRASTDPQIIEHLGHCRSQVLQIPGSPPGSPGNALTRTTSLSLPAERWAGPAYSASPAPSSLPLPKFSLLGQKMPSMHVSPLLVERQKCNVTKPLELGSASAALGSHHAEGDLDVALATMSLRRMLKLDPS